MNGSPSSLMGGDVGNHQNLGLIAVTEFTGSTRDPLDLSDRLLHTLAELAHDTSSMWRHTHMSRGPTPLSGLVLQHEP